MSTATLPATDSSKPSSTVISFVPLGEKEQVHLTIERVAKQICLPTRSGKLPDVNQILKFMMLCKAQRLNPWVNDAYLVGYDSKDGPSFSLIVSHQAILKRSEASEDFDGIESGVVVLRGDSVVERPGKITYDGEKLLGGWCRVHRKNLSIPVYDSVNLGVYNTGRSRWAIDPAGMIVKVAEAAALRKMFPSNLAALYCQEELDNSSPVDPREIQGELSEQAPATKPLSRVEQVKAATPARQKPVEPEPQPEPEIEQPEQFSDEPIVTPQQVDALRKAVRDAWKDFSADQRLELYQSWGVNDPGKDESFDFTTVGLIWEAVEKKNDSIRE